MKKQILKKTIYCALGVLGLLVIFTPVYAAVSQEGWNPQSLKATNLPDRPVADILLTFIDWALIIVGLLGVIAFIYGGFIYLTAQGDPQNIEKAKRIIIYAIIGIAVAVLGYVAVETIDRIMKGNIDSGGGGTAAPAASSGPANSAGSPNASSGGAASPAGPPPAGSSLPISPGMVR